METNDGNVIQLELKYCERCGGLWVRRLGTDKVYCASCSAATPEFGLRKRVPSKPKLPVYRRSGIHGEFELIHSANRPGGNA